MFANGSSNAARTRVLSATIGLCLGLAACGGGTPDASSPASSSTSGAPSISTTATTTRLDPTDGDADAVDDIMFPDVIDATASFDGTTWTISATLSSPYDSPERYADAWRVVGPDGTILGERILAHDHAAEQPFTRAQRGIAIPDDVVAVTIEGRDLQFGYGGATFELTLPR